MDTKAQDIEYAVKETLRTSGPMTYSGLIIAVANMSSHLTMSVETVVEQMYLSRAIQYDPPTRRYSLA